MPKELPNTTDNKINHVIQFLYDCWHEGVPDAILIWRNRVKELGNMPTAQHQPLAGTEINSGNVETFIEDADVRNIEFIDHNEVSEKNDSSKWDFEDFKYAECVDIDDLCRKLKYLFDSSRAEHFDLKLSKGFLCQNQYNSEEIEGIKTIAKILEATIFTPEDEMSTGVELRMWRPINEDGFFNKLRQMIGLYFDDNETMVEVGQSTDFKKCNNFNHLKDRLQTTPLDQRPEYVNIIFRHNDERILRYPKHILATKLNGFLLTPSENITQGIVIKINVAELLDDAWGYMHTLEQYFESGISIGIQDSMSIEADAIDDFTVCPKLADFHPRCTELFNAGVQSIDLQIHCYTNETLSTNAIRHFAERTGFEILSLQQTDIIYLKITREQFENDRLFTNLKLALIPYFNKGIVAINGR